MAGSSKDVDAARMALERARGDLETQLAAEPAWAALEQLEARIARGEPPPGIDYEALKSRLARQLDAAVADWRTLPAIDAAIAALGTPGGLDRETRAGPPPLPVRQSMSVSPPPLPPVSQPPQQVARTRYGPATSRPSATHAQSPPPLAPRGRAQPPPPPREQTPQRAEESGQPRRAPSAGNRIASALGLTGDGPARLTALEAEIERMMRREVGTWDKEGSAAPSPPPRASATPSASADAFPDARQYPPTAGAAVAPALRGEEAEVEIVALGPSPPREEPRPISRLADRLTRVDRDPAASGDTPVAMPSEIEEAEVEIVLLDEPGPVQLGGSANAEPPAG